MNKHIKLKYSVLQYMPDPIRRESINVGIVFHCPEQSWSKFVQINNRNRIRAFDDEYDSDYIALQFRSMHFEFDSDVLDEYSDRFEDINKDFFLEQNTKFYVNEFRFLPVETINSSQKTIEKDIFDLERTFLYYDRPKGERINTQEVRSLMKKQLSFYNVKNENKDKLLEADYTNQDIFDFISGNNAYKAISFDKNKIGNLSNELKVFSYDLLSKKESVNNFRIYIIYDNNLDSELSSAKNQAIFKEFISKLNKEFDNIYAFPLSKFAENIS
ncbi:DUF3037 domain-containing protein [Enterococcus sp. AZ109]|uniref:DUF3037 domain-containing protein n=1 Tax=Enterococcus sp. AZ109 TaxID=2774634 RepID=UPI003F2330CD